MACRRVLVQHGGGCPTRAPLCSPLTVSLNCSRDSHSRFQRQFSKIRPSPSFQEPKLLWEKHRKTKSSLGMSKACRGAEDGVMSRAVVEASQGSGCEAGI